MHRVRPPLAEDLRKAPMDQDAAVPAFPDDTNASVAGEEDPGAALDLVVSSVAWSGGWCPWPKGCVE